MKTPRDRFAVNLRKARDAAEISQEELAKRCDLHRTEISLLERGGREPRMGTIIKLACALDVTPEDLCAGVTWNIKRKRFTIKRR